MKAYALLSFVLLLSACGTGLPRLPAAPTTLLPLSPNLATEWAVNSSVALPGHSALYFEWQYADGRRDDASGGGPGSLRLASPDSLRLDFRLPLGAGRGAAMVIGDSTHWAEPRERMNDLVPEYHLLWALVGVARAPNDAETVVGASDGNLAVWEYTSGVDTVRYAASKTPHILAVLVRQAGEELGRVQTEFDPQGLPLHSALYVPGAKVKLELRFNRSTIPATFPEDVWRVPSDSI